MADPRGTVHGILPAPPDIPLPSPSSANDNEPLYSEDHLLRRLNSLIGQPSTGKDKSRSRLKDRVRGLGKTTGQVYFINTGSLFLLSGRNWLEYLGGDAPAGRAQFTRSVTENKINPWRAFAHLLTLFRSRFFGCRFPSREEEKQELDICEFVLRETGSTSYPPIATAEIIRLALGVIDLEEDVASCYLSNKMRWNREELKREDAFDLSDRVKIIRRHYLRKWLAEGLLPLEASDIAMLVEHQVVDLRWGEAQVDCWDQVSNLLDKLDAPRNYTSDIDERYLPKDAERAFLDEWWLDICLRSEYSNAGSIEDCAWAQLARDRDDVFMVWKRKMKLSSSRERVEMTLTVRGPGRGCCGGWANSSMSKDFTIEEALQVIAISLALHHSEGLLDDLRVVDQIRRQLPVMEPQEKEQVKEQIRELVGRGDYGEWKAFFFERLLLP